MSKLHLLCIFMFALQEALGGPPPGGPGAGPPPPSNGDGPPYDGSGGPPMRGLVCQKGVIPELFDERCCGDASYTMGHVTALLKFYKDCAVEPEDKSLNIPEAQWTFFKCVVEKSLASEEITTKAFVNMMAGTLDDSTKSKILEIVEKQAGAAETDKINLLKNLWENYFTAENKVCNDGAETSREIVPLLPFKSSKAPLIMFLPMLLRDAVTCQETYRSRNLTHPGQMAFLCFLTVPGLATESDLQSKSYDYDGYVNLLMPKYSSQGSREKLLKATLEQIKVRYPNLGANPSSEDITKSVLEERKAEIQALPDADQTFISNGIVFSEIAVAVMMSLGVQNEKLNEF